MDEGDKQSGVPQAIPELKAILIPHKRSGEEKCSVKRRVVNGPAFYEKGEHTRWHGMLLKHC